MCLAAVEGWSKVGKGRSADKRRGVFIVVLVGGRVVNKNNQLGEAGGGGGGWFCYSTASKGGRVSLKWLLAVGEKCETMSHVNEKPRTRRQTKGVHKPVNGSLYRS